jgi:hypothetical protein
MTGVTVLAYVNRISLFYSLAPLLRFSGDWVFTGDPAWCLKRDRNRTLIITRLFDHPRYRDTVDLELMARLADHYRTIVFFDDSAGGGGTRFEVMPYVTVYWKKHLFRDRTTYLRPLYGRQLYTDYYATAFDIRDTPVKTRLPLRREDLGKLRLAWNLGAGTFPLHPRTQRAWVALQRLTGLLPPSGLARVRCKTPPARPRTPVVHARFAPPAHPRTIAFQRACFLELVQPHADFLTGRVRQGRYVQELESVAAVLSPFGWGEICFRDFEAIQAGALLVKPDVSHLETFPQVFEPGETYLPVRWDGSDLLARAREALSPEAAPVAGQAWQRYQDELALLDRHVEKLLSEVVHP